VNFAKDLLDVSDNLERALESSKNLSNENNVLYEGVKLTKNSLD
jgi:molecular chaperone GrpE (heat shock protein)